MPKQEREHDAVLEQRAAELKQIVEQPSDRERAAAELAKIERELAGSREAKAKEAAQLRLLGIRRAYGSVASSLDGDEQRLREAVALVAEAVEKMNGRFHQLMKLKAEAAALGDRFGLAVPALPQVTPPALRDVAVTPAVTLVGHVHARPKVERCEHGLRERRNYHEVQGTEGHAIISEAGLKPWPDLTDAQIRIVEQRAREAEESRRQLARMGGAIQGARTALAAIPGGSGVTAM